MKKNAYSIFLLCAALLALFSSPAFSRQKQIGAFEGSTDIGDVLKKGSATHKPGTDTYEVAGSGYNVWFDKDEFHYLWKKMPGDFILYTRARLVGEGVDPHRKVGWMVRSDLSGNSSHVNAVVHGDGLTSLQYREAKGVAFA